MRVDDKATDIQAMLMVEIIKDWTKLMNSYHGVDIHFTVIELPCSFY